MKPDVQVELERLRVELKLRELACDVLCEAAEEYIKETVPRLRGRPGRHHPVMVSMRKLDHAIERAKAAGEVTSAVMKDP